MTNELAIAGAFNLGGSIHDIRPYGDGLINDTYVVTVGDGAAHKVILQRINDQVFSEPRRIMENLRILLDHIHRRQSQKGGDDRCLRLPDLYPARNGGDFVVDNDGAVWRAMTFIDNARAYACITHAAQAEEVGAALGCFHILVSDLDPGKLRDSLRGFHDTPRYLELFAGASERYGKQALSGALQQCYVFIDERRMLVDALEKAKRDGELSPRTVHGDPKLDNFLFDQSTGKVVSLIDLDTVQPGLLLYDIGDKCDEPKAEHPREQERANFCDYFKPNPHANVTRDMTKIRAAKNALDDLFGRQGDGSPSDNPRSALDDFFDSGAKKDK